MKLLTISRKHKPPVDSSDNEAKMLTLPWKYNVQTRKKLFSMTLISFHYDKDPVTELCFSLTQFTNGLIRLNSDLTDAYEMTH